MTEADMLRPSRDGDQFHYHWAARQSLKLLRQNTDLTAVAVEGVSPADTREKDGEQVIDLAEYYGGTGLKDADRVVYRQLKHSTLRARKEWSVSGFHKTVHDFAKKFTRIRQEFPGAERKVSFQFVSNRVVKRSVLLAIEHICSRGATNHGRAVEHDADYLRRYAGFARESDEECLFFSHFQIDETAPGLFALETLYRQDLATLLPGAAGPEYLLLKEMVARRATSLEQDPVIVRSTVLAQLNTTEELLLPAPNLILPPENLVATAQAPAIMDELIVSGRGPMIVHASGGVGKSVLTTQLAENLPGGSVAVVYDCFGNGGYRCPSTPRHQHQQGLVQLSNELAAQALCDPLIPSGTAQPHDYSRAFMARVRAAADALSARCPGALLVMVVDAADNAVLAAQDLGDRAFVTDLVREDLPSNVRLVMLCRSERINLLELPPRAVRLQLQAFGPEESQQHLESAFGKVTDLQAREFHRRTGGNPRIQAFVLQEPHGGVDSCLASLGETCDANGGMLSELLRVRVADCRDAYRGAARDIDELCRALAALRPRVPLAVLSKLCEMPPEAICSFVSDLQRPLIVDGESVQFRDEPTESWFRDNHRPSGDELHAFIAQLMPLAASEPYVAASLPELLWEAGQVDVLVELALTDGALPDTNELERREIAQQRLQYALRAALRAGRDFEAARLAVKAGALAAGQSRTLRLLRDNTDLAGQFLAPRTVEGLVAERRLAGEWPGSHLAYEGALLSVVPSLRDLALSRLRSAVEWMVAWVRRDAQDDSPAPSRRSVGFGDIAEVALGLLNADGVDACVSFLSRWRPQHVVFEAGLIVATRLAEGGRVDEFERLALASKKLKSMQAAVACAAWKANLVCGKPVARQLAEMLKRQRKPMSFRHVTSSTERPENSAVVWIVAMAMRYNVLTEGAAAEILRRHLPTDLGRVAGSRSGPPVEVLLCGFALLARCRRRPFDLDEVSSPDILEARASDSIHSRDVSHFQQNVVPLVEWALLWIDCVIGQEGDTEERFATLAEKTFRAYSDYESRYTLIRSAARLGAGIVASHVSERSLRVFADWLRQEEGIGFAALIDVVCATATSLHTAALAIEAAQRVPLLLDNAHLHADEHADELVKLARAIYRFAPDEARTYFMDAIAITERVGDDAHARTRALLALASAASIEGKADDRRAYRVAQIAEGLEPYVGDAVDQAEIVRSIGCLSATTMIAVASRWRDRNFCSEVVFARVVTGGGGSLGVSPVAALSLLPFAGNLDALELLGEAFRHAPANGARAARVVGEFLRSARFSTASFEALDRAARTHGVNLAGTLLAPGARQVAVPQRRRVVSSRSWDEGPGNDEDRARRASRAREAIGSCDLTTVYGWEAARQAVAARDVPLHFSAIVDHALSVPWNKYADMLEAFVAHPQFSVFDYKELVDRVVELPLLPRAARQQLRCLAEEAARRFCRNLTTRSYDPLNLPGLAQAAEADDDLLATALRALGSQPTALEAEECFEVVCRLAQRLPPEQARVALDDLCALLSVVAAEDSGDGPFDTIPPVPGQAADGLAGYIWAALGAPDADTRWRAAHCVRLLAGLRCVDELGALHQLALGASTSAAFTDARLPFYDRHALQWLLYAIARTALNPDDQEAVRVFVPLLMRVAFKDAPHAVIQASAKGALMALVDGHAADLSPADEARCIAINAPTQVIKVPWQDLPPRTRHSPPHSSAEPGADIRFFLDFREYWCAPLARAFGLDEADVERRAHRIAAENWHLPRGRRADDPRHELELYGWRKTHTYKSEWPEAEDLDFYLAVHALCGVAGELIRDQPVYHGADHDEDLFTEWLGEFLVSRPDGRWLADRRDASPPSTLTTEDNPSDPEWVWRLSSNHFAQRLFADDGWATVWEHSHDSDYDAKQQVWVRSALVNRDHARALLTAVQTMPSAMSYRLPAAGDHDFEFDAQGFELTGWVTSPNSQEGADTRDPHAGTIHYPPPHPADDIVREFDLVPDADMRIWTRDGDPVLRSSVWNHTSSTSRGSLTGQYGDRLQIRRDFLADMLAATGRSLVLDVTIGRTHEQLTKSYARSHDDDDAFPFVEQSFKAYLFDDAGGCTEL